MIKVMKVKDGNRQAWDSTVRGFSQQLVLSYL